MSSAPVADAAPPSPAVGVRPGAALRLETPEGIELELRPAGPVPRGLALMLDEAIAQAVTLASLGVLALLGRTGFGLALVVLFFVEWFYPVLFEVLRGGRTPGKQVMGLRVVNADATPIGWNASLLRNLLRVVDALPGFYLVGIASLCVTRRFQRLGDLAANTLVVHDDRARASLDPAFAPEIADLGARRPPISLDAEEQRALLAYAERQGSLSPERAIELAEVLAPLTGASGEEGRRALLRIANGLAGEGGSDEADEGPGRDAAEGARDGSAAA